VSYFRQSTVALLGCVVVSACVTGVADVEADRNGDTPRGGTNNLAGNTAVGAQGGAAARGGTSAKGGAAGSNSSGGSISNGGAVSTGGSVSNGGKPSSGGATSAGAGGKGGSAGAAGGPSTCMNKRGLACGFSASSAPQDVAALSAPNPGVSWFYNWGKSPGSQIGSAYKTSGVEWVPMVWGGLEELDDTDLASKIHVEPNTKYLLGFNEPNFHAQANLSPERAAQAWVNVEKAADELKLELVGPAVNFCGGGCNQTDPFVWLDQFLAACKGCRIDYVAFHSYACEFDWFKNDYMRRAVDKYYTNGNPKRKIWLTEFACADNPPAGGWSTSAIDAYMKDALNYLEYEPAIFRYSWFADRTGRCTEVTANNNLLSGAGQLTSLGATYTGGVSLCK
jgi:hypothetical protein